MAIVGVNNTPKMYNFQQMKQKMIGGSMQCRMNCWS